MYYTKRRPPIQGLVSRSFQTFSGFAHYNIPVFAFTATEAVAIALRDRSPYDWHHCWNAAP